MDFYRRAFDRMTENESFGMQPIPQISGKCASIFVEPSAGSVEGIANQRMPCRRQMNADLVRSARLYLHFQDAGFHAPFQNLDAADGSPAVVAGGMQASESGMGHRADAHIDGKTFPIESAAGEGAVDFRNPTGPNGLGKRRTSPNRACK